MNLLLVEVENLYFLWFPARWVPGGTGDFQAMGRQLLLMMAKVVFLLGLVAGVAAGLGAAAYFSAGESWAGRARRESGWCSPCSSRASCPLVAQAFVRFDVARTTG